MEKIQLYLPPFQDDLNSEEQRSAIVEANILSIARYFKINWRSICVNYRAFENGGLLKIVEKC